MSQFFQFATQVPATLREPVKLARHAHNTSVLRFLSLVLSLIGPILILNASLFSAHLTPGSTLFWLYISLYSATSLTALSLFIYLQLAPARPTQASQTVFIAFAVLMLLLGAGITVADFQDSADYSAYMLALLAVGMTVSLPIPAYLLVYTLLHLAILTGLVLTVPKNIVPDYVILTIYSLLGVCVAVSMEYRRIQTALLAFNLDKLNRELKETSFRDPLTGVYNRRFMVEVLISQMPISRRNQWPLSVALIDIDYFKKINDTLGHLVGDQTLKDLSSLILGSVRDSDIVARYGGEEFVILLPKTELAQAIQVLDRVLATVAGHDMRGVPWKVTFSAGITQLTAQDTAESFLHRADELLYAAKKAGRARCQAG